MKTFITLLIIVVLLPACAMQYTARKHDDEWS